MHFEPSVRDLIALIGGLVLMAKAVMEMHELVEGITTTTTLPKEKPVSVRYRSGDVDGLGVQFGQRDHRRRDGRRPFGHGGGGADICKHHAGVGGRYLDVCIQEPHREDAGFGVLAAHRSLPTAEGVHHIEKRYIYFAMGFSIFVERSIGRFEAGASNEPLASTWSTSDVSPFLVEHFRHRGRNALRKIILWLERSTMLFGGETMATLIEAKDLRSDLAFRRSTASASAFCGRSARLSAPMVPEKAPPCEC